MLARDIDIREILQTPLATPLFYFTVRYLRSFAIFLSLFFLSLCIFFLLSVFLSLLGSCTSYRASRIPSRAIDRNAKEETDLKSRGRRIRASRDIHFSGECKFSRERQTQLLLGSAAAATCQNSYFSKDRTV